MTGESHFTTQDGVRLHYLERGRGETIVFLTGWSQTAAMYKHQLAEFGSDFHCIALNWRGHGESAKPSHGYRIARLAMDLHELIAVKQLQRVTLVGHSLAVRVIYGYWELFGADAVERVVLVDQAPLLLADADFSVQQKQLYGAHVAYEDVERIVRSLREDRDGAFTRQMLSGMFTDAFPTKEFDWVIVENLKFPREYAARLIRDNMLGDPRDILPNIQWTTLVIGGGGSRNTTRECQRWLAEQIPNARVEFVPANEGGSHFCFLENPAFFNQLIREFLISTDFERVSNGEK